MARNFQITKAVKGNLRARISLSGPPGAGKTMQALILAQQLADRGRILLIDTEFRSASLYADKFDFHTVDFERPYDPLALADLLDEASGEYDVIIVDSLSHFWSGEGGVLSIADGRATGWKHATPVQDRMIDSILAAKCHMICNTRAKTETILEADGSGKMKVRTMGMKVVQRADLVYEFTIAGSIDKDTHALTIEKSRFADISDRTYQSFGDIKGLGQTIKAWLNTDDAQAADDAMRAEVAAELDKAAQASGAIEQEDIDAALATDEQKEQIKACFATLSESEANVARAKFTDLHGLPNTLLAEDFEEALADAQRFCDEASA